MDNVTGPIISEVREIKENEMFSIEAARNMIAQLASGLTFIHLCNVVHGDK